MPYCASRTLPDIPIEREYVEFLFGELNDGGVQSFLEQWCALTPVANFPAHAKIS